MGQNLTGSDARIWRLHAQGFPASQISQMVGMHEGHVRGVIAGVWLDDKLSARKKAA